MSTNKSRFSSIAQAVRDRTADPETDVPTDHRPRPVGAGVHKPAAALGAMGESLRDHVSRLEAELAKATSTNIGLTAELQRARVLSDKAGDAVEEFLFLPVDGVVDRLPRDRLRRRVEGREFEELLADIESNGQNDAVTVRRASDGLFEVAAGRRRLEVCRRLSRPVLARVRDLDDQAMLRIQFSENERRADISALERARWFSEVRDRLQTSAKEIAAQFGIDPSTLSLYLRLARFPDEILDRLEEPQRLAVLPARRVMEAIESDPNAVQRILGALDTYRQSLTDTNSAPDPAAQIDVLIRAAEGRGGGRTGPRSPVADRRHIVHQGRRIGTLTRNGGQWVFRFATSIPDTEVHLLTERLAVPIGAADGQKSSPKENHPATKRK
jgi:ParB family transcriptional regulator, chromosome partitioning protein